MRRALEMGSRLHHLYSAISIAQRRFINTGYNKKRVQQLNNKNCNSSARIIHRQKKGIATG